METTPQKQVELLRNFIKFKAANKGLTLAQLMAKASEIYKRKPDAGNFSAKLRRGTLSILELYEIFDILGIDIKFEDRK